MIRPIPLNKKVLAKKVLYGEADVYDADDRSNIFYQIVSKDKDCDSRIDVGDLISPEARMVVEKKVLGEVFYSIGQSQIDFVIKENELDKTQLKDA